MDKNEKQKRQSTKQFLKITLQFLVSASLLSFLLSYHYDLFHIFCYCYSQLSTLLFLERKYMFLICNGIVAFLAKSFSFTSSSPSDRDLNNMFVKTNEAATTPRCGMDPTVGLEEAAIGRETRAILEEFVDDSYEIEESESLAPELSEEAEGNEADMSADELNRKFDEFIRRMKEEIRIGAQRQRITF